MSTNTNPEFEQAITYFKEGKYIEALEIFSLFAFQGNLLARQYLARCYYRLAKFEQAYKHFQYLAEHGDIKYQAYAISMQASIQGIYWGNHNEAISILQSLPPTSRNQINLSISFWKRYKFYNNSSDLEEALSFLDNLTPLNLDPLEARILYHMKGLIYQAKKNYRIAKDFYETALKTSEGDTARGEILNDLASLYIELNRLDEAEQLLHEARSIVLNRDEIQTAFNDKWFQVLADKRRDFQSATDHTHDLTTAIALYHQHHITEALELFLMILGHAEHATARKYLALCYFRMEKYDLAAKHFSVLAASDRDYAVSMLATIALIQNNFGEAIKHLKELPPTPVNLVNLAIAYWQKFKAEGGDWLLEEALRTLRKINTDEAPPHFLWRIHITRGMLHQARKEHTLAESHYQQALTAAADPIARSKILNEYGFLYIQQGRTSDAGPLLEEALELIRDKSPLDEGFNAKYRALIMKKQRDYKTAKELLQFASTKFKEQSLFRELAEVNHILVELHNPDLNFYEMASYFAEGVFFEKQSETAHLYDAKVIDFLLTNIDLTNQPPSN